MSSLVGQNIKNIDPHVTVWQAVALRDLIAFEARNPKGEYSRRLESMRTLCENGFVECITRVGTRFVAYRSTPKGREFVRLLGLRGLRGQA